MTDHPQHRRELRRRAEERLDAQVEELSGTLDPDALRLMHDLQLHQIELELQNEEMLRTREALEDSQAAFADLYEHAPVGYLSMDESGLILRANLTAATLFRTERTRLEGCPLVMFIPDGHRSAFWAHLQDVERAEGSVVTELRLKRKDGESFDARFESIPIRDGGKAIVCRTAIADITERKRAESEVASLARFPQQDPSPVLRISAQGLVLRANPAVEEMLASLGSGVGMPAPAAWNDWVRTALRTEHRQTARVVHGARTFSFDVVPFFDDGYANLYGRDISVQERTLEALRHAHAELEERVAARTQELGASTELLEGMFDDTHLLLAQLDATFRYVRVNRAYAQAIGRDAASLRGVAHFPEGANDEHEAIFARALKTGEPYSATADDLALPNGPPAYWDWSIKPLRGPEGRIIGLLLSMLDVTARVRLDQELEKIEERERRAVSEELHDTVGQQLTAIGYMIDNLEAELSDNEPAMERLGALRAAVRQADAEVRSLSRGLNPAQIASGGLSGALEDLARGVEERYPLACSCACPSALALEDVAVTQLLRIAQEAVTNAVKHGHPEHIDIQVEQRDDRVTLTVRDDGVGIGQPVPSGGGLGLQIMVHRAASVGGHLAVDGGEGGGTVVTCCAPCSTASNP